MLFLSQSRATQTQEKVIALRYVVRFVQIILLAKVKQADIFQKIKRWWGNGVRERGVREQVG